MLGEDTDHGRDAHGSNAGAHGRARLHWNHGNEIYISPQGHALKYGVAYICIFAELSISSLIYVPFSSHPYRPLISGT